jgi:hypothetical protein
MGLPMYSNLSSGELLHDRFGRKFGCVNLVAGFYVEVLVPAGESLIVYLRST